MYPRLSNKSFAPEGQPTPEAARPSAPEVLPPEAAAPEVVAPEAEVLEDVSTSSTSGEASEPAASTWELDAAATLPEVRFEPPASTSTSGEAARASVTLELHCDDPRASIRYAVDVLGEAEVDESSPLYDPGEKILLTQSATVSARAWVGGVGGPLSSARYQVARPGWEKREPTDRSDPVPHEASQNERFADGWAAAAAAVRGKLHAHRGSWREDSFAMAQCESAAGTWAILAVADGAGSAPLSRVGSRLACEAACSSLERALRQQELSDDEGALKGRDLPQVREALVSAAREALGAIEDEAARRGRAPSEMATTLLLLARCAWKGRQVCAALQVGDGAIALLNGDGLLTLLGAADHGEHSSETRFLTTPGIEAELAQRVKFSIRSDLVACAVMSDGVADDFFPEEQRLPEVFTQVLPRLHEEEDGGAALLDWLGYEKRGSSDDRTLAVSWRPTVSRRPEAADAGAGTSTSPSASTCASTSGAGEGGEERDASADGAA